MKKENVSKKFSAVIALSVLLFGSLNCDIGTPTDPVRDNPIDPRNPVFIPPKTTVLSGPGDGSTVTTADVTFTWTGNQPTSEFSYRITNYEWSDWSTEKSITFTLLDEILYEFEVKSRFLTGTEETDYSDPPSVNFTVDAVKGPAFTFYRRHSFTKAGDSFSVDIIAEEVTDLFAASVEVLFDPNLLEVTRITAYENEGDFLKSNAGDVVPFFEYDNQLGSVWIDIGVAAGDPVGVTGSGALANIQFRALRSGESPLRFVSNPQMRDPDNISIFINAEADGIVEIE